MEGSQGQERGQCQRVRADGSRCRAHALPGRDVCCFHAPDLSERCRAGRKQGGRTRMARTAVLPFGTPDVPLATVADIGVMLADTVNRLRRGELDAKIANALGYLSSVQLKVLESAELSARVAALEERLQGRTA